MHLITEILTLPVHYSKNQHGCLIGDLYSNWGRVAHCFHQGDSPSSHSLDIECTTDSDGSNPIMESRCGCGCRCVATNGEGWILIHQPKKEAV
jgi:hypothetical protein